METFDQYLSRRMGSVKDEIITRSFVDRENEIITFPLWTFTGRLIGYQQHNWRTNTKMRNDAKGRYWSYHSGFFTPCWGLEFYNGNDNLYVTEGIFDAIRVIGAGFNAIAVLANHPKHLKNFLQCLPNRKIGLCDGDKAGRMLSRVCDDSIILPEGKDANDFDEKELREVIYGSGL